MTKNNNSKVEALRAKVADYQLPVEPVVWDKINEELKDEFSSDEKEEKESSQ